MSIKRKISGMKNFQEIRNFVASQRKTCHRLIDQKKAQIEKLECRLDQLHWTEAVIRPLMSLVREQMPQITDWDDGRYTPLGLCCRVSIFPKFGDKTLAICFVPGDEDHLLRVETGKQLFHYPGKESVPVESVEQIVEILNTQIRNS